MRGDRARQPTNMRTEIRGGGGADRGSRHAAGRRPDRQHADSERGPRGRGGLAAHPLHTLVLRALPRHTPTQAALVRRGLQRHRRGLHQGHRAAHRARQPREPQHEAHGGASRRRAAAAHLRAEAAVVPLDHGHAAACGEPSHRLRPRDLRPQHVLLRLRPADASVRDARALVALGEGGRGGASLDTDGAPLAADTSLHGEAAGRAHAAGVDVEGLAAGIGELRLPRQGPVIHHAGRRLLRRVRGDALRCACGSAFDRGQGHRLPGCVAEHDAAAGDLGFPEGA
mmetsp:Transcript_20810/g.60108  ORF Transcript_20810/g.60108 Transcript_20810/m.60108 type:complete len:284 (-) Transcript_20810:158-1009(-)